MSLKKRSSIRHLRQNNIHKTSCDSVNNPIEGEDCTANHLHRPGTTEDLKMKLVSGTCSWSSRGFGGEKFFTVLLSDDEGINPQIVGKKVKALSSDDVDVHDIDITHTTITQLKGKTLKIERVWSQSGFGNTVEKPDVQYVEVKTKDDITDKDIWSVLPKSTNSFRIVTVL